MRFCQALLGPHGGAVVEPHFQRMLGDLVRAELSAWMPPDTRPAVPLDATVQYLVSAFTGLLRWWMEQPNRSSAEEVDRQFRTLSLPTLGAALGVNAS